MVCGRWDRSRNMIRRLFEYFGERGWWFFVWGDSVGGGEKWLNFVYSLKVDIEGLVVRYEGMRC